MKNIIIGTMLAAVTLAGGVANAGAVDGTDHQPEYYKHHVVQADSHGEYINTCSFDTAILGCWKYQKHYLSRQEASSIPNDVAAGHPRT